MANETDNFVCGRRDIRTRSVNRGDSGSLQHIVVLRRDDAAADDDNVARTLLAKRIDQRGDQGLVSGGLRGHADDMHIVLDGLTSRFFRCLEQGADIDVEADIGESGGDDFGAAIMPVLTQFHDQHARPATFVIGKLVDLGGNLRVPLVAIEGGTINAGY